MLLSYIYPSIYPSLSTSSVAMLAQACLDHVYVICCSKQAAQPLQFSLLIASGVVLVFS